MKWWKYEEYRDSGAGWLGMVPEHWAVQRLKLAVSLRNDKVESKPVGSVHIGLENIESWTGRFIEPANGSETDGVSNRFTGGDVLFGKLRPYLAKAFLASQCGYCSSELLVLGRRCLDPKFLHYLVLSDGFVKEVDSSTYGAKMPRASWDFIGNMRIPIPSNGEQRAIAAFLDRETAKIDALMAMQQRLVELLQEKRIALVTHAVTKGLRPCALKVSGFRWLGEIPRHWDTIRLKFAAKLESGHTPSRTVLEYWENCTIPWVTLNDVDFLKNHDYISDTTNYINELGIANSSARILPTGTVILSRDATVGRCGILGREMATSQHFVDWICAPNLIPEYLLLIFRFPMQQEFERLSMGATIRTIGMPEVNSFRIPLPPVREQAEIVAYVKCKAERLGALILKAQEAIQTQWEYRASLISAAVTGRIDVRAAVGGAA